MGVEARRARSPLVIAKSPIALALALEATADRGFSGARVVLLSYDGSYAHFSPGIEIYAHLIERLVRVARWPRTPAAFLRHIGALGAEVARAGRRSEVLLGADVMADSYLHFRIAQALRTPVGFVDDGIGTAVVLDWLNPSPEGAFVRPPVRSAKELLHPYRARPAPKHAALYTMLPLTLLPPAVAERARPVRLEHLDSMRRRVHPATSGVWLIGQNLPALEVMPRDRYLRYLRQSVAKLAEQGIRGETTYFPHPEESVSDIEAVQSHLGCAVGSAEGGVEFLYARAPVVPEAAVSPFSTALVTLRSIGPGLTRLFFWDGLTEQHVSEFWA
jgi:hypothetical protein